MTDVLFQEWLQEFDDDMRLNGNVVIILDNALSHILYGMELQSVTVVFLPPNTISKLQPMDAGIIASLKRR